MPRTGAVLLTWDPARDQGSPIIRYELSVDGGSWMGVGNVTSFLVENLSPGTTYRFQVRAVNANGAGGPSNSMSATPL